MRGWLAAWSIKSQVCCRPPACCAPTPERWATRESSRPRVLEMVVDTQAGARFADARSTAYEPTAASRTYYLPMPADGDAGYHTTMFNIAPGRACWMTSFGGPR